MNLCSYCLSFLDTGTKCETLPVVSSTNLVYFMCPWLSDTAVYTALEFQELVVPPQSVCVRVGGHGSSAPRSEVRVRAQESSSSAFSLVLTEPGAHILARLAGL